MGGPECEVPDPEGSRGGLLEVDRSRKGPHVSQGNVQSREVMGKIRSSVTIEEENIELLRTIPLPDSGSLGSKLIDNTQTVRSQEVKSVHGATDKLGVHSKMLMISRHT
jgi:hypothetical protein